MGGMWGMGRHTRANAEICLLATKGKGLSRINASIRNTHLLNRGKHSQKPNNFRYMIEALYGDKSRIELFARQKSEGWDVWGNEVESDISLIPTPVEIIPIIKPVVRRGKR